MIGGQQAQDHKRERGFPGRGGRASSIKHCSRLRRNIRKTHCSCGGGRIELSGWREGSTGAACMITAVKCSRGIRKITQGKELHVTYPPHHHFVPFEVQKVAFL